MYSGVTWPEAMSAFEAWCVEPLPGVSLTNQNAVVVTCGSWDLNDMFVRQCTITGTLGQIPPRVKNLFKAWTDVKYVHRDFRKYAKCMGMGRMLADLGLKLIGKHHSGIDDCNNIARCCIWLLQHGCYEQLISKPEKIAAKKFYK